MTIFFTSDTHFGHYNIVDFCKRPIVEGWPGVPAYMNRQEVKEANDKFIISRWNERIQPTDDVYHLGDFAFYGKKKTANVIKQLNGKIHLIRGNHDGHSQEWWQEQGIVWVRDYYVLRVHDSYEDEEEQLKQYHQNIVLCHFPILSWENMHYGTWHLHGHCHGGIQHLNAQGMRMDVGVDCNDWYPLTYEQIKGIMLKRSVVPVDHHKPK